MQTNAFEITGYNDSFREQVLKVWEDSVLATHDFLSPEDFFEIREIVQTIDFNAFPVYCLVKDEIVAGFIGVADRKIEMLFLDPNYLGQGLGRKLTEFAITESGADRVDVNEQNIKAVEFYRKAGFETFERSATDDQGRNYPLLRMKLRKVKSKK